VSASRPHHPLVLGILGGIASGKSEVAHLLATPAGLVLSADELAHAALDSEDVLARLRADFGPAAIGADGRADRRWIADRIFGDSAARERLQGWIHPIVRAKILAALEEATHRGIERVVLDVPLLLENDAEHGLARACDHLIFVQASDEERERRARASRGWSPGEVARRERTQMPLAEKRRRARWVIPNEGTLEELHAAVQPVLAELEQS
jgi:dephospho-CoA kinase